MTSESGSWVGQLLGRKKNRRAGNYKEKIDGSLPACETLETRVLPAVDLIISAAAVNVQSDPPLGSNQYIVSYQFTVKNLGTTPVDVNGVANDISDNVLIRIYGSLDATLDNSDLPVFNFSHTLIDNGPKVLAQNETAGIVGAQGFLARQTMNFWIFKVDNDDKISESNENNNTFAVNIQPPSMIEVMGTSNIGPKESGTIHNEVTVRDLNTTNFQGGNLGIVIDGAQAKDKFLPFKVGTGEDRLRLTGAKLKLGSKTIGTVTKVLPKADNGFQMSLQVEFTGEVSRDNLNRLIRNVRFRAAPTSTGNRTAHIQIKDNLENFSNVIDRTIHVT